MVVVGGGGWWLAVVVVVVVLIVAMTAFVHTTVKHANNDLPPPPHVPRRRLQRRNRRRNPRHQRTICGPFPPYFTNSIPYMYSICFRSFHIPKRLCSDSRNSPAAAGEGPGKSAPLLVITENPLSNKKMQRNVFPLPAIDLSCSAPTIATMLWRHLVAS